ncbi:MAG TPA: CopD family protein [bacterium]|nr:CopD family protein [bacterium]
MIRALLYLGALLMLGSWLFVHWVAPELTSRAARHRAWVGAVSGAALLALGSIFDAAGALARAVGVFDVGLLPSYLIETRQGNIVLVRLGLVGYLLFATSGGRSAAPGRKALSVVAALGILATFSFSSHAAGLGGFVPVVADLLHFIGAAVWGGALIYLAWLPIWPDRGSPDAKLVKAVRQVSRLGLIGVGILVFTGVYASILHLWGVPALTDTPYGHALLYKVGVVIVILAVAAVNRWLLVPTVSRPGSAHTLARLVKVESILIVAVLGLTGLLTSRPTPEPPATIARVVTFGERVGEWTVRGTLAPRLPHGLDLTFGVSDAAGNPPPESLVPEAVLTALDHEMAPTIMRVPRVGPGVFRVTAPLPMAGRWQVSIRLPGGTVRIAAQAQTAQAAPSTAPDRARPNPIVPTQASVARGEGIYRVECQSCHGVSGAGDGPAAAKLDPRPADLRVHVSAHTDGELFHWISEGFPGTAMPAFKDRLSEEDRWNILNFLRALTLTDR